MFIITLTNNTFVNISVAVNFKDFNNEFYQRFLSP